MTASGMCCLLLMIHEVIQYTFFNKGSTSQFGMLCLHRCILLLPKFGFLDMTCKHMQAWNIPITVCHIVDTLSREYREKTVLEQGDGTITYVMNRTFYFEENSNYSENDIITTINFVYVVSKKCMNECKYVSFILGCYLFCWNGGNRGGTREHH